MNLKQQLEIQALVDGELAGNDASRVQNLVANDREARGLFEELSLVKTSLIDSEPEMATPEAADFYFSQIRRRIEAEERKAAPATATGRSSIWTWLRGHLGTVTATAAVVAAIALFGPAYFRPYVPGESMDSGGEMSAMTFRSERDGITIVYLFDSSSPVEEDTAPESAAQ